MSSLRRLLGKASRKVHGAAAASSEPESLKDGASSLPDAPIEAESSAAGTSTTAGTRPDGPAAPGQSSALSERWRFLDEELALLTERAQQLREAHSWLAACSRHEAHNPLAGEPVYENSSDYVSPVAVGGAAATEPEAGEARHSNGAEAQAAAEPRGATEAVSSEAAPSSTGGSLSTAGTTQRPVGAVAPSPRQAAPPAAADGDPEGPYEPSISMLLALLIGLVLQLLMTLQLFFEFYQLSR